MQCSTDFAYLFLNNHEVRYNCTIIDLHDRRVPTIKGELILHSDQDSPYTSKAFVEFCESVHMIQSMSKVGDPYDNAPMERYFNTLKNEYVNLYEFKTEEALYQAVEEFAYVTYNHVRPHSYNGYHTPYQARIES